MTGEARLAQDSAEFPVREEQIVGPAELDCDRRGLLEPVGCRDRCREREDPEIAGVIFFFALLGLLGLLGPNQEREIQAALGGLPPSTPASLSRALGLRQDNGAMGRAPLGERGRENVGGIGLVGDEDETAPARAGASEPAAERGYFGTFASLAFRASISLWIIPSARSGTTSQAIS